jgi:copper chaperone CopZ
MGRARRYAGGPWPDSDGCAAECRAIRCEARDGAISHCGNDLRGLCERSGGFTPQHGGVVKADVDYKPGKAVVVFDTAKQSADSLSKFITECGYHVKEIELV